MQLTNGIVIPDEELEWTFARSGGPGGQNVNKVESKAQLRWRFEGSLALAPEVMARLLEQQRNRLTSEGALLVTSQEHREQERNRQACVDKLEAMIEAARRRPVKRRPTKPSRSAREKRMASKRRRSEVKENRRPPD